MDLGFGPWASCFFRPSDAGKQEKLHLLGPDVELLDGWRYPHGLGLGSRADDCAHSNDPSHEKVYHAGERTRNLAKEVSG